MNQNVPCGTPPRRWIIYHNKMALKFAVNISFAFLEYGDFLDRFQAAKNAGNCIRYWKKWKVLNLFTI